MIHTNDAITEIIAITEAMEGFWRHSSGWASNEVAILLASARLDRQTSFTRTLGEYLAPFPPEQAEAKQILGYATLRSLCEGVLKLFFAIYLKDYLKDPIRDRKGAPVHPKHASFDRLIKLYSTKVDSKSESFLRRVQGRGNAIHHFNHRDIGIQSELIKDIVLFRDFLLAVDATIPYPHNM